MIRKELTTQLVEAVIEEIPKDVVGRDAEQIQAQMS